MNSPNPEPNIQSLFPDLTPDESRRAEENIDEYLGLVVRIYTRISQDPASLAELRSLLYSADEAQDDPLTTQP
jgi:hypothetical protein